MTVTCGGRVFPAHRNILCPASKFFTAAINGEFKEKDGNVKLGEVDPSTVTRMLKYLYTGNYDDMDDPSIEDTYSSNTASCTQEGIEHGMSPVVPDICTPSSETTSNTTNALHEAAKAPVHVMISTLTNNIFVYAIADEVAIPLLKDLAKIKFEVRAADEWAVKDIVTILPIVYATTPPSDRGLRQIMLDVCLRSMERLMCNKDFRAMLHGDASICFDVLDAVQMKNEERELGNPIIKDTCEDLEKATEWNLTLVRLFKEFLAQNNTCRNCGWALEISVTNGPAAQWRLPIVMKCRRCRVRYMESCEVRVVDNL
ncbi:MAG: hypothetical protein Q9209_002983 [Squamulea sp. 1 TL-2023]